MSDEVRNIIIVGSGPAGITASIYAARSNLSPMVIGGITGGGQLSLTTIVENYPGFEHGVDGPTLMLNMRKQAMALGVEFIDDDVSKVDFSKRPFTLWVGDKLFLAKAVILATGADTVWLGVNGEERLRGRGVSSCATCDGYFFQNKKVVVIGGGDTALEEATYLSKIVSGVTVVHRRDTLRAVKAMQERAFSDKKINFVWNATVLEILGDAKVTGMKIKDIKTGEEKVIETDGVFVAIGHKPSTEFLKGAVELTEEGYIKKLDDINHYYHTLTSVEGIFTAGDVDDKIYRQAVVAAGEGCSAALDAERWLGRNN